MARIPFADQKLIPPGANDPRIAARIGILHVDAANAYSLYEFFKERSGGIESHAHIRKNGSMEQYRDTAFEADANYKANAFALSFETQGYGEGEWTDPQIAMIKRTMLWCREAHGIPLRVVESWNDSRGGWGYHTLFGAPSPWTPVAKSCPGPDRKLQFHKVLVPWMKEQSIVAFTQEDRNKIDYLVAAEKATVERDKRVQARILKALNVAQTDIDAILEEVTE